MASPVNTEPFPSIPPTAGMSTAGMSSAPGETSSPPQSTTRRPDPSPLERRTSSNSALSQRKRTTSLTRSFLNSSPPYGVWHATGEAASRVPTFGEIRNGSFSAGGWTEEGQLEARGENPHQIQKRKTSRASLLSASGRRPSTTSVLSREVDGPADFSPTFRGQPSDDASRMPPTIPEVPPTGTLSPNASSVPTAGDKSMTSAAITEPPRSSSTSDQPSAASKPPVGPDETGSYPNGYRFPPKHTWWQSTVIGSKAFWTFFLTPFGFLLTIYGLNVVAWGAMLFFILLNAAPAMCHPTCNDRNSARNIWIEIDSQILNALFCVTGFGLIPWRFRDFYYLIQWRVFKKADYFRRLAGHNRGWFRLPGSDQLDEHLGPPPSYNKKNPKREDSPPEWSEEEISELEKNAAIPLPATSMPPAPLTGVRARPTKPILMDVVIWMYVLNTVFQACLAGAMWGLNRFTRPPWVTGFLICIAFTVAIIAGLIAFLEGKKIKKIEGIPVPEREGEGDVEKGKEALGLGGGGKGNGKGDGTSRGDVVEKDVNGQVVGDAGGEKRGQD